ncbi:MAG: DUF4625 domain-containing protein [Bacteroidota bacterium]
MKISKIAFLLLLSMIFVISCDEEEDIDTQKPSVHNDFEEAFPENCDTLYFGETFDLKLKLSDNVELGSFNIGIHNNFDHHSHSTEVTECDMDPVKEPVNPFTFIEDYSIPDGLEEYETGLTVSIPSGNDSGLYDEGDYHFFISLTDKEGWSSQKGLSIKMLHR